MTENKIKVVHDKIHGQEYYAMLLYDTDFQKKIS